MIADTKTLTLESAATVVYSNVRIRDRSTEAQFVSGTGTVSMEDSMLKVSHEVTKTGVRRSLISVTLPVPVTKNTATGSYTGEGSATVNFTVARPDKITENSDELTLEAIEVVKAFVTDATIFPQFFSGQA